MDFLTKMQSTNSEGNSAVVRPFKVSNGRTMKLSIRAIFCVMFVVACVLAIGIRARHIGDALGYVESIGGDVWFRDKVCDGLTLNDLSISKSKTVSQVLLGESTDIWLCDLPDGNLNREKLVNALVLLNPKSISFDFCDQESLTWTKNRFARAIVKKASPTTKAQSEIEIASLPESREPGTAQERFLLAIKTVEDMQKQDPQFWYRCNRYEVIFASPPPGDSRTGYLYDNKKGRTFAFRN